MANASKVRYAVIGAGNLAQTAVLPAFAHATENSELVALVSGDAEKRATLCERYSLEFQGDYDALERVIERGGIDAVYIATPNSLHREFALRAAAQGVHVLCEKPLAPTAAACAEMGEACARHGSKLMVAYRLHFEPATLEALAIARSGRLGELRLFSSCFTHVVRPGDTRREPNLAGGASYDLGVYCINAARNLFAAEPIRVIAQAFERLGADDTVVVLMTFPGERAAQFCISNSVAEISSYRIAGTRGDLRVEPGYEYEGELVHHLTVAGRTEKKAFKPGDQFAPELHYFSDCIRFDREPEPSAEEGLCDVRVVEAVLASARRGGPVDLPAYHRSRRPSLRQAEHVRPVQPPEPVAAPAAASR